jgi:hypothetical protein
VLEDDVDPALIGDTADFVVDFLSFVIDEMVGAELFCLLQLFIAASSGNDARPEKLGNLDGSAAHAASCPKDENIFAGLQLGSGKKHVPSSLEDKRNRGGLFEGQVFRIRHAIYFWSADKFGTASVDQVAEIGELAAAVVLAGDAGGAFATSHAGGKNDPLTDAHGGYIRADLGDFAGDVATWDVRERNRDIGVAAADPEVKVIQSASFHADEDFVRADSGLGSIRVFQDLRSTVLMEEHCLHWKRPS